MGSILRISGKKFNVDDFSIGWRIKPSAIHRKGDLNFRKRNEKIASSQIIFDISDKGFDDLNGQINETIKFLRRNKAHLLKLTTDKTIQNIIIDFSFNSRIGRKKVAVQLDHFPQDLIKICGELGAGISLTQW